MWLARGNGFCHERGKLPRGPERPSRSSSNNRCCNRFSKPFFTIFFYDLPDFSFGCSGEPFGSRRSLCRVHAHVEWRIAHEAESPMRGIELRRRNAEIQQNAVHASDADRFEPLGESTE